MSIIRRLGLYDVVARRICKVHLLLLLQTLILKGFCFEPKRPNRIVKQLAFKQQAALLEAPAFLLDGLAFVGFNFLSLSVI
jgi:hypothetical protein